MRHDEVASNRIFNSFVCAPLELKWPLLVNAVIIMIIVVIVVSISKKYKKLLLFFCLGSINPEG